MNSHVTHILMENVEGILTVFPVRDHSYLSADWLFGRTKNILCKKASIICMKYWELLSEMGTVKSLGHGVDIKDLQQNYTKLYKILLNLWLQVNSHKDMLG
jgi:hypothetical protein